MHFGLLLEHTFRFLKQVLGWTAPKLRDPAAAGRWTWIIIAAFTDRLLSRTRRPASCLLRASRTG